MRPLSTALYLGALLVFCWALTIGLTWAPCYSQVCPENYHPLATRMHIVAFYGILASIFLALLLRRYSSYLCTASQRHLTRRELPLLRKRISIGGLFLGFWIVGVVLATTAFWFHPLTHYWTTKLRPLDWKNAVPQLVLTGLFAHHADILLGLLLIPVGRNSVLGQAFSLQQHTLLFAHKLLANLLVLAVTAHAVTYYTFVADWIALPWKSSARKKAAIDLENPNMSFRDAARIGFYYAVTLFTGTLSFALMLALVVSSLPGLRRNAYNTFYYLHIVLSFLVFIGTCIHSATNFYFVLPGLFLWVVDWAWRLFQGDTGLMKSVDGKLENAGNGWYRISLPESVKKLPPALSAKLDGEAGEVNGIATHPLQTYYLNIPSISRLQIHPYTPASVGSASSGPVFLFQRISVEGKSARKQDRAMKNQWTWKVGGKADSTEGSEISRIKNIRMRAEGPYLPPDREFENADRIVCVVGGTGVTGAFSLAEWFVMYRMYNSHATFTIVWSVRHASMAVVSEWQTLVERSVELNGQLRLRLHASSEYGRLNVDEAIRAELAGNNGGAGSSAWVYVSGPAGLLRAAEDTCCDIEVEMRVGKKGRESSTVAIDNFSYQVAKWDV